MVSNPIELDQALYGSRVLGEPKSSGNVSREINVETRDSANRETVGVGHDDLGGEDGGGVSERRRKIDGFVSWASSVTGFRAFGLAKHSCCKVHEGVNRERNVESGISGVKTTTLGPEIAINNDGLVSGVKVDEGEGNADGIDMGGEKGNEGARVPQMCSGNIEVSKDRMVETEERRTTDENNVVGATECFGNDGTGVNVLGDLKAQACAGEKHLSVHAIGGEGIGVEEVLNESDVSLDDGGVNNAAASFNEGVGPNENQDAVCKEPMTQANLDGMDGNDFMVPKIRGEECQTEKEGEYYLSDLVWGKVRRHPWWPGQIFEPSAASEKALKHSKKECYLIAYFGDQTFAWNQAAKIKPFHLYFTEMEKQSNLKAFSRAVGCALDEVSRRVQFGLSCSCLPEEQRAKIECQTVVNSGILEEASKRYAGDKLLGAPTFVPADLLRDFKSLAASPTKSGFDRLRFVLTRAQLVAFNRWKGLPEFTKLEGKALSGKLQLGIQGSSLNKSATKSKGNRGKKRSLSSSSKKEEAAESVPNDSKLKRRKRILSPMSRQKESPPTSTLEFGHKILQNGSGIDCQKLVDANFPPPKEMLSKLCLAALDPMEGYGSIYPFISLFSTFRNSVCLEISMPEESPSTSTLEFGHKSPQNVSSIDGQKLVDADFPPPKEMLSKLCLAALEPMEGYGSILPYISLFSTFRNSTCLDNKKRARKRKVSGEEQDKGEKSSEYETVETFEVEGKEERDVGVLGSEAENAVVSFDDNTEEYSPTALSLKFNDLESLPSVKDLIKILSRFGPLNESQTEVDSKSKRAKVVFKRRSDAETASSSAKKASMFGHSLLCYRLKPLTVKTPITKRNKKAAKSAKGKAIQGE